MFDELVCQLDCLFQVAVERLDTGGKWARVVVAAERFSGRRGSIDDCTPLSFKDVRQRAGD